MRSSASRCSCTRVTQRTRTHSTLRLTVPPLSRNSSSIASLVIAPSASASSLLPPPEPAPCSPPPFCQRSRVFRSAPVPACHLTGEEPRELARAAAGTGVDVRGCAGRAGDGVGRAALEAARLLLAGEKWSGVAATGEGRGARALARFQVSTAPWPATAAGQRAMQKTRRPSFGCDCVPPWYDFRQ